MPIIGKGTKQQSMVYHNGAMCGALNLIYILPDTKYVIVVLSNSSDLYDTPHFVGQLLVEAIVDTLNLLTSFPCPRKPSKTPPPTIRP